MNETTPFLRGNINTENIEGTSIENGGKGGREEEERE